VSLLTSGKLVPSELVESLVQLGARDLAIFGPLILVVGTPEDPNPSFLGDLIHSVLRDAAPISRSQGWMATSEMPTMRVPSAEAPDADQVELLAELDGATHCIVPLRLEGSSRSLTLGRSPHNRILVSDPSVSGDHAELIIEDGGIRICDRGSKNGTHLNGVPLRAGSIPWLQPMDRLTFGRVPAFACDPRTLRAVLRHDLRSLL